VACVNGTVTQGIHGTDQLARETVVFIYSDCQIVHSRIQEQKRNPTKLGVSILHATPVLHKVRRHMSMMPEV
jgi:hypothetical protein